MFDRFHRIDSFRGRGSIIESSAYSLLVSSLLRTAACVVRGGRKRYDFSRTRLSHAVSGEDDPQRDQALDEFRARGFVEDPFPPGSRESDQ